MRKLISFFCIFFALALSAPAQQQFRDGDIFRLAIGGAPREYTQDFELEYTVDGGMVTIPMIGRMRATGMSSSQLAATIEKRLRDEKIFTNPSVILNPVNPQRVIIVGGAVRNPGRHPWTSGMTLTQSVASASGFSEWATDKIKLTRGNRADLYSRKEIRKNPAADPQVLPNDFIEVQGDF